MREEGTYPDEKHLIWAQYRLRCDKAHLIVIENKFMQLLEPFAGQIFYVDHMIADKLQSN